MRKFLVHVQAGRTIEAGVIADTMAGGMALSRTVPGVGGRVGILPSGLWVMHGDADTTSLDVLHEAQIVASRLGAPHAVVVARVGELAISMGFGRSSVPPASPEAIQLARVALLQRGISA